MEDWLDIDCDAAGRVEAIHLLNNRLSGSIPPELGKAINLSWLVLTDNQLSGDIPAELGDLIYLSNLDLDRKHLSGDTQHLLQRGRIDEKDHKTRLAFRLVSI